MSVLRMEFKWMIVLLLLLLLLFGTIFTTISSKTVVNDSFSSGQERATTDLHKSHVIKSIQSEDGDIIDCIDIYKQPAFDHPALKDHKIQLRPSHDVKTETTSASKKTSVGRNIGSPVTVTTQTWHKSGSCPKGTIPVRRHSASNYARKTPVLLHNEKQSNESKKLYLLQTNHSMAILHADGFAYMGAKGDIRVWNPKVESNDEYSTSQVALKSGPYYDYEAIEAGWAVNPKVYGDRKTRLFVYWTVDANQRTGCFDVTCPGFVQTSNEIALGAAIYPISNPTGLPYQITIYIHKVGKNSAYTKRRTFIVFSAYFVVFGIQDPATSNWWVQYGETINIGYWPHALFALLKFHAETVQWGGEVYSPRVGTHPHTSTAMGNGQFPDYVFGNSGSVKRMRVVENNMVLRLPQWVNGWSDEYDCYGIFYLSDYVEEPEFYFGGPGRNPVCP
ncbi:UNVERIFIED_CONTAM: hypothetical protein Slati_1869800 [Sesamum latifolium]|uniref:Neprosin PEP catalytic domain-containing protein n=1 Tax=Sesamum latifolium TaxID=2727402 RepID=A0AAW2X2B4_9LAMI